MDNTNDIRELIHSRRRALQGSHDFSLEVAESSSADGAEEFPDAGSIRQRFELRNLQSASLSAQTSPSPGSRSTNQNPSKSDAGDLPDVSRKLDEAATKMDKAFSNAKTIVLLKD